jgi:hypothetical protein
MQIQLLALIDCLFLFAINILRYTPNQQAQQDKCTKGFQVQQQLIILHLLLRQSSMLH